MSLAIGVVFQLLKRLFCFCLLLGIVACSGGRSPNLPQQQAEIESRWQLHLNKLAQLTDWKISARIGIIAQDDSGNASLFWEQRKDHYSIRIVAPMGKGVVNITGTPEGVSMLGEDGDLMVASSAEELIWRRTGWLIPVEGLASWALGMPDQSMVNDYSLDELGRLKTLHTSGWNIEYLSYQNSHGTSLPRKIRMQNEQLKIKLVVRDWEFL